MSLPGRLSAGALAASLALFAASAAHAQGHGGGGGGRGMGGGGGSLGGGGMGHGAGPGDLDRSPLGAPTFPGSHRDEPSSRRSDESNQANPGTARSGLQFGPPGRWWDDKSFAKNLRLRPDQQARMDAIFEQNRPALLSRYQGLQQAQAQMDEVARSPNPDENALFSGIDRVAQARAELEKATTHYLLQLRREMDGDQLQRLEKQR